MSSAVENILKDLPLDQIAGEIGLSPEEAQPVVSDAISTLLAGMGANAADPDGAASLAKALPKHEGNPEGPVSLGAIDTKDGGKIVKNVFGDKTDQVAEALGKKESPAGKSQIQKLLPMLAPIVMAYLAKQAIGGKSSGGSGGGVLGDVLGSVLGGASKGSGGGLGEILGGLLGGGRR